MDLPQLHERICQKGEIEYPAGVWVQVSPQAKDLTQQLTRRAATRRPSAAEALQHRWLQHAAGPGDYLTVSVLDGLRRWQGHNKLKQAVLRLLAKELTEVQIQEIRRKFIGLDKNNDGFITIDELMRAMLELGYDIDEGEVRSVVSALDASGGAQKIGYQEFISALIERRMKFERSQLLEAFKKLDVYGEGKITQQALQAVLKNQGRSNSRIDVVP